MDSLYNNKQNYQRFFFLFYPPFELAVLVIVENT